MQSLPYFKHYVNDWLTGSIQLYELDTQAFFINLCCLIWKANGRLSIAQAPLARLVRIEPSKAQAMLQALVDGGIVKINADGSYSVDFITEQISEFTQTHNKKVLAGKKGAQAMLKHRLSNAQAMLKHTDTDTESDTESDTTTTTVEVDVYDIKTIFDIKPEWKRMYSQFLQLIRGFEPATIEKALKAFKEDIANRITPINNPIRYFKAFLDNCQKHSSKGDFSWIEDMKKKKGIK